MKILIIEDHPKLRENISKYLKANSYLPESAFNGKEALEKIAGLHNLKIKLSSKNNYFEVKITK